MNIMYQEQKRGKSQMEEKEFLTTILEKTMLTIKFTKTALFFAHLTNLE